jgi:ABC-type branched-subunit amino acid transport system substrate-binding protein
MMLPLTPGRSGASLRRRFLLALPAALLLLLAACSSSSSGSGTTSGTTSGGDIKVMVIAPFTLAVAPAQANYDAVRIQAQLQNAKGGINGHKIEVIGCDDQSNPNVGAQCAQQAVREHVAALLGVFTLVGTSIWPIINAAGIPEIGLVQYGPLDMTSPNAWPVTPAAPVANASSFGYLAKAKGCKAIADIQADAGSNSQVPLALDKAASAAAGVKYVGPYLLPATQGLANAPAIARSVTSKADCANIADGQNGIILMKAILQQDPSFKFATNQLSLPTDWVTQLGSQASAAYGLGGLAPDTSTAPGMVEYLKEMKAKASSDTLSEFSKLAWASWYAFAQVASTIKGPVTAQSVTAALGKASSVSTEGMTPAVDFTKRTQFASISRIYSTKLFVLGAQDGRAAQVGLVDARAYLPG